MGWIAAAAVLLALAALVAWLAVLLAEARRARRRFRILGEVAEISDGAGSLEETLTAICDSLVPRLADFGMIDVIAEGRVRRASACVAPGCGSDVKRCLGEREPSLPRSMVEGGNAAPLTPRLFERVSDRDLRDLAHDADDLAFLESLGVRSAITVALTARGQVTGALTLGVAWSGRRYRRDDARFASVLAGRVALALDNSGLFAHLERTERDRARIAETLQRDLLPPPLPPIPGWSVAAMYRPAGAENEVGGDFYDAFEVAGGWMLVIGDVTGRGAHAASITAEARYTLRAAAMLTGDPLKALKTLNRALLSRRDSALCSLAIVSLGEDPLQPVRLAVAGHPPPLIVDGEAVVEAAQAGPLLGAFADAEWRLEETPLPPGQQLVIVTDGIVEAQGPEGRFGEERLHAELADCAGPAKAVQRLEGALHSFARGALDDDAAILAIAPASSGRVRWPLAPARPAAAAQGTGER